MAGGQADMRALGKAYGLFAAAFAVLVLVVAVVAQLGLADAIIAYLIVAFTLVASAVVGIGARTLSLSEFTLAGRRLPAGFNGLATAAAFLSAGGVAGLVGAFFAGGGGALAAVAGWMAGFVLLAVLIAPYYRKSGAVTLPDFLAVRYGNPLVRLASLLALLVGTFALVPASLVVAVDVTASSLNLAPETAAGLIAAVLVLSTLPGGMRGASLVGGAQMIVVLFAVLAPAAVLSARAYGLPLAQLTYGYALADRAVTEEPTLTALAGSLAPVAAFDPLTLIAVALSLALGVPSLPHVVGRSGTTESVGGARRSIGWALVAIAAVALTAPAIAALGRVALVQAIVGVPLDELPGWLFALGADGLVKVCGVDAVSAAAIGVACGAGTVINGIAAGDLTVSGDAIMLAFAEIGGIPYVMTALIAAGVLAAALATASAVATTIATALSHDLYGRLLVRRATAGRRLILARLVLIALAAGSAMLALAMPAPMLAAALLAPGLSAAAFFPPVVLGIWWNRIAWAGALAGMAAGFAAALATVAVAWNGLAADQLAGAATTGAIAALIGVAVNLAAAVGVTFLTAPPGEARLEVVEAIRRPGHDPLLEDHAA